MKEYPWKIGQKVHYIKDRDDIKTICRLSDELLFYTDGCFSSESNVEPHFEEGDLVRVLDKTAGDPIYKTSLKINEIYKIKSKYNITCEVLCGWLFNRRDLEWIPEEDSTDKIEYELLVEFGAKEIKDAQKGIDCREFDKEYIKFLEKYDSTMKVGVNICFETFIEEAPESWIDYGIKHKFFKKLDKKVKVELELTENELNAIVNSLNTPYAITKKYPCGCATDIHDNEDQSNAYFKFLDIIKKQQ